jgi:putative lipoic acid-binding regulatory protein
VPLESCHVADRLNGRYLSVRVRAFLQHANMISEVYEELSKDGRILMKY